MFFKKTGSSWFAPIRYENFFSSISGLLAEQTQVFVLHEQSADHERVCKEIAVGLERHSVSCIQLHLFLSLNELSRDAFHGAIVATYEAFTSAVVSQWLPQGLSAQPLPVVPIVALGIDSVCDGRVSRVFLPLLAQPSSKDWREMHSVSRVAWSWLSDHGGVEAVLNNMGDGLYESFYQHVKTAVGKEGHDLRSVCYQSIYACIKSSQDLVEGVHYARVNDEILWAGKDGTFHSSNIKHPVVCAVVRARLGLPSQELTSTPEVVDIHPFSLLKQWGHNVFGCSFSSGSGKPFAFKDGTLRVSDSLKGQNMLLQRFIDEHKGSPVFVLVNDKDYLAGLATAPAGVVVLTTASYLSMMLHSQSRSPVICLQMPRSERALRELIAVFRENDVLYEFALCGHDGRLGASELEWLSIVTQCVRAPTVRWERKLWSFWLTFWENSKDQSAKLGVQYRLDELKLSTLRAAFTLATSPLTQPDAEMAQLQERASMLGVSHLFSKLVDTPKATRHFLWVLFLLRVQESLLMHRLGSVMLPVQLSLSSEKTSNDMEEMKIWKSLTLRHKQ